MAGGTGGGTGGSGANWGGPGNSGARNGPGGSGGGLLSRGSGANAGTNSGANRRRNPGWDDEDDFDAPAPPPTRSNPRNRRSSPSSPGYGDDGYQEIGPDRALAPSADDLMPLDPQAGLPALPVGPLTEEEERALGIRRPVYIPATDEKRKRRLSSWRVVSGVLSVMLVCAASCAGAGLLGQKQIAKLFIGPIKTITQKQTYNYPNIPATPVATPGLAAKYVKAPVTAPGIDKQGAAVNSTSIFSVGTTIWVVGNVQGVADNTSHTVSVQWFLNGIDIQAPGVKTFTRTSWPTSGVRYKFSINFPQPGQGAARIYWDSPNDTGTSPNDPNLAQTIYFGVYPKGVTPTPTPVPTSTPAPTKTPSPTNTPHAAVPAPVAWREVVG